MTPLAHRIAKERTLPLKRRTFKDDAGLLKVMDDVHCFEVSEVIGLARDLACDLSSQGSPLDAFGGLAFLPAPRTWIEWKEPTGRVGYHLWCEPGKLKAIVIAAVCSGSIPLFVLPLDGHPDRGVAVQCQDHFGEGLASVAWILYALLTMINSPRRINQRVIMPNAGLQRALARAHGAVGKWPLHAYHELTLKVNATVDASDAAAWEDHLSNRMPLHFVRSHKRRVPDRFGPWVQIPATWRGTCALGIKQTRYRLAA